MTASLSGVYNLQVLTSTGAPAASYRLYTFTQGTTTHKACYTDAAASVAQTYTSDGVGGLYIALNARGELPAPLFLTAGPYDLALKDSSGAAVWTRYARGQDDSSVASFATLADTASTADGDALVGVLASDFASAVATTQHAVNRRTVNAFDWFTAAQQADVISRAFTLDVSAAVQKVCDEASDLRVIWPAGLYRMNAGVTHPQGSSINWVGAGKTSTEFRASGAFNALLTLGDLLGQKIRGHIEGMCFSGQGATLQYGIYGARVEEHDFVDLWLRNCATAGSSIGYGYVNNYVRCEWSYNTGDGSTTNIAYGTGGNNAISYTGCLMLANDGFGVVCQSGYGLSIDSTTTIEQNKKVGIYLSSVSSYKISAYFEGNAITGHVFATPARTVHADIIISGSGDLTTMSNAFPSVGGQIVACKLDQRKTNDAFIWNAGASDLTVTSSSVRPVAGTVTGISVAASAVVTVNTVAASNPYAIGQWVSFSGVVGMSQINARTGPVTAIGGSSGAWTVTVGIDSSGFSAWTSGGTMLGSTPLIGEMYDSQYKGSNTTIENCSSFVAQVVEFSTGGSVNNTPAAYYRIKDAASHNTPVRNLATTDMLQWSVLTGGTANTYRRSASSSLRKWYGCDVFEILSALAGTSDVRGFSLAAADYPEFIGRPMWYGLWVYCTDAACYAVPYCSAQAFNSNPTTLGQWTFLAVSFTWPASGTLSFGVSKAGTATTSVYFAAPMLAPVGSAADEVIGTIPTARVWKSSAMPASGYWDLTDRVERTPWVVGQPKGWARITAGTGNVLNTDWVSEGNL
jgi:hypothetical protein